MELGRYVPEQAARVVRTAGQAMEAVLTFVDECGRVNDDEASRALREVQRRHELRFHTPEYAKSTREERSVLTREELNDLADVMGRFSQDLQTGIVDAQVQKGLTPEQIAARYL